MSTLIPLGYPSGASARARRIADAFIGPASGNAPCCLLADANLLHISLVVPEQIVLVHHTVLPVTDRAHYGLEGLARRVNRLAVANRHGLLDGSFHDSDSAGPSSIVDL